MKHILLVALAPTLLLVTLPAHADHKLEVVGHVGSGFTGDIAVNAPGATSGLTPEETPSGEGHLSFDGGPVYGGMVALRVQPAGFVYVGYTRHETTGYYRAPGSLETSGEADVRFDYLQFGGNLEARRGIMVPFFGFSLGAMVASPIDSSGNDWSFSMALEGGLKVELFKHLHLRFTGKMPISFVTGDSNSICISGLGCGFSYTGDPLWQGQALIGLGLQL